MKSLEKKNYFLTSIPHVPCACASAFGHGGSIRLFHGPVARMVFRTHDGFSFPGTSLRVAFSSSIRAGLGRHYYPEQLQTMYISLSFRCLTIKNQAHQHLTRRRQQHEPNKKVKYCLPLCHFAAKTYMVESFNIQIKMQDIKNGRGTKNSRSYPQRCY